MRLHCRANDSKGQFGREIFDSNYSQQQKREMLQQR
jgi:hypothetical protein